MNEIELTPKQIVAELDKYIVGQGEEICRHCPAQSVAPQALNRRLAA